MDRTTSLCSVSDCGSEFVKKKKKTKYVGPLAGAWRMFSDFSKNSTVHGVKYLGERKRHWTERAFWIIVFMISVTGCSYLIGKMYDKYRESPVISSFAEKSTPIWQIPFPAVTICPETKVKHNYLNFKSSYNSLKKQKNLTTDEHFRMEALAQVCMKKYIIKNELSSDGIVPILQEIALKLNENLYNCKWENGGFSNCSNFFTDIMTEEGPCYTFNMLDSSEIFRDNVLNDNFVSLNHTRISPNWSLQGSYKTNDTDAYPRRVLGIGEESGIQISLWHDEIDIDYICRGSSQGYKVIFHTPGDIPRVAKHYFRVPLKQDVTIIVKPNIVRTSEELIEYSSQRRQCYFEDEKYLKFFKVYSQNNCELESLTNFTLKACKCVKFSMPRDNSTAICGQKKLKCCIKAKATFIQTEIFEMSDEKVKNATKYNCLPSCTAINYDYELTQKKWQILETLKAKEKDTSGVEGKVYSKLSIYFEEGKVSSTTRSELYGFNDFMANCGGLLGLFMGVSILSVIEIIYYITLRLACTLNCRRGKNRIIPKEKVPTINVEFVEVLEIV